MAFNQVALQNLSLSSPKLQALSYGMLSKMSNSQLRVYLASEKQELAQIQTAIGKVSGSGSGASGGTSTPNANLTERQQLVREIQETRAAKMNAASELIKLQAGGANASTNKIDRDIKRALKKIERERKRREKIKKKEAAKLAKKEAKKDKFWEKGIRKGSSAGGRAHDRIKRFFDSSKWTAADKDRMRELLDDIGVYEGDEAFQILTLLESNAFDSVKEAEDFLNERANIQEGRQTSIQRMNGTDGGFEEKKNFMEQASKYGSYQGPGINMTF